MRLIDADALDRYLLGFTIVSPDSMNYANAVAVALAAAPTIDAEPVRHGWWVIRYYNATTYEYEMVPYDATRLDNPTGLLYCSECNARALLNGHEEDVPSRYCPECGAKMDGGATNGRSD